MSAEQISGQARQFASREYLHALYKGDRTHLTLLPSLVMAAWRHKKLAPELNAIYGAVRRNASAVCANCAAASRKTGP